MVSSFLFGISPFWGRTGLRVPAQRHGTMTLIDRGLKRHRITFVRKMARKKFLTLELRWNGINRNSQPARRYRTGTPIFRTGAAK